MPPNLTATMDRVKKLIRDNANAVSRSRRLDAPNYQGLPDPTGILAKLGICPTSATTTSQHRPAMDLGDLMKNLPSSAGLDLSGLTSNLPQGLSLGGGENTAAAGSSAAQAATSGMRFDGPMGRQLLPVHPHPFTAA